MKKWEKIEKIIDALIMAWVVVAAGALCFIWRSITAPQGDIISTMVINKISVILFIIFVFLMIAKLVAIIIKAYK